MTKIVLYKILIQIETTGIKELEAIEEIEVLFLTCDEIASLEECSSLKKLVMIDNGLKGISNLTPVAMTLTTLCLCDQQIKKIENLELPLLQELLLHRNDISVLCNLEQCPRLRKLWLFQNKITSIKGGLSGLTDLEECWLQGNTITSLAGIERCKNLKDLSLAGNPISEFSELKRLDSLPYLESLSLSDIHFGQCTVAMAPGYREFVICFLAQVKTLDGVLINKNDLAAATLAYNNQVKAFNGTLQEVEDSYRKTLQNIDHQQHNKEVHAKVLEKEMMAALTELQGLVQEGRAFVAKEVRRYVYIHIRS
jgi:Leucine-rich repeat (LRR) protein